MGKSKGGWEWAVLPLSLLAWAIVVLLARCALAAAQPPAPMQTIDFYVHGPCVGQDDVANNQFSPWQAAPVMIVGVDMTVNFSGKNELLQQAYAGNSVTPDIMALMGTGQSQSSSRMAAGYGMLFGWIGPNPHVDMHVACQGGAGSDLDYQGLMVIHYTAAK